MTAPIHTLDLFFQNVPRTIASYVIEGPGGFVMVETGPTSTLPNLIHGLSEIGIRPQEIKDVLVTHIHFDHAGAVGWWAQQGAQIYVHHVGAPHLIDPSRLIRSAKRIYAEKMDSLWGEILPVPLEQVTRLQDRDVIEAGGLALVAHDTPGHANHHMVYTCEDIAFTGDAAGMVVPPWGFVDIPAPPPEFNQEVWRQSLQKIEGLNARALYPTHFGKVNDVALHLELFTQLLIDSTEFIRAHQAAGMTRDGILHEFVLWQMERGLDFGMTREAVESYEVANPRDMSVDGILRYLRKQAQRA